MALRYTVLLSLLKMMNDIHRLNKWEKLLKFTGLEGKKSLKIVVYFLEILWTYYNYFVENILIYNSFSFLFTLKGRGEDVVELHVDVFHEYDEKDFMVTG